MRILFTLLLLALAMAPVLAQRSIYDDGRGLYRREVLGGVQIHGDGWGVFYQNNKHINARDRRLLGVEVVSMKHPKEIKSFNPYYEDSRGYFYGKANSMLILRPMFGRKHQLTDKIRRNGVEVNTVWAIGPSLALLKPIYLQIGKPDNFPYESIVIERYDPARHGVQNIYGRATWFRGFGEMAIIPGGHGRFGFNFEHSGQTAGIKSLEVGVAVDAYPVVVPIMAEVEDVVNKQFFLQFYLALQFGKKLVQ